MPAERGFLDRVDAGRRLGRAVAERLGPDVDAVVLGLPRGGVTVAAEVAAILRAPLDVVVVRKLGVPGHRELAMGAIAGGTRVLNDDVVRSLRIDDATVDRVAAEEAEVAARREHDYRGVHASVPLQGRVAVVVDDGLATGATARAAVQALRRRTDDRPARVLLAVPVAPADTLAELAGLVDDVVCLLTPRPFFAVGEWYATFGQVEDEQVRALLAGTGPGEA
jgi:putative phosphoribosyl transferase